MKQCFKKHPDKLARNLNISGKMLARFVDVLLKLTGQSLVSGSRVTLPKNISLVKAGYL